MTHSPRLCGKTEVRRATTHVFSLYEAESESEGEPSPVMGSSLSSVVILEGHE